MRVRRRWVRDVTALGLLVALAACATVYGEEPPSEPPDRSQGDAASGDGMIGEDGGATTTDGAAPDVASDAPTSSESCPPCPQGSDCVAAGCSGPFKSTSCTAPVDVTAPQSLVAFVCPEASTVSFPSECVPNGGTADHHVAVFRMGKSGTSKWRIKVTGSNAFAATGTCQGVTGCSGGTNGPSNGRVADDFATVMVGTTNKLATCQQLPITFDPD